MGEEKIRREVFHLILFVLSVLLALERSGIPDFEEEEVYVRGRIVGDVLREGGKTVTKIKVEESEVEEIEGRKCVLVVYGPFPGCGCEVSLIGKLKVKEGKVYIYARGEDVELSKTQGIREVLMRRYSEKTKDEEIRGLGLSFLFGEPRELIDPEVQKSFLRTGLVHLLVISGLHVGTIAFILSKLLPRFWGLKLSLIGVSGYTLFIVPHEPPVLRATIMAVLIILSHLTFRNPNHLSILLFSGTVILFVFPYYVSSYSFWLSFFATGYIILTLRDLEGGKVFKTFLVSASAFSGVAPLVSTFSYISPISVLLTPLIAPLVVLYSLFGILSLFTLMSFPPFVDLFNLTGKLFVSFVSLGEKVSKEVYPQLFFWEAVLLSLFGAFFLYVLKGRLKVLPLALVNCWLFIRSLN